MSEKRTEGDYEIIVDEVLTILHDSQLTYQQKLHDALELMDRNELYGCMEEGASNYCATCIFPTDTCLFLAVTPDD